MRLLYDYNGKLRFLQEMVTPYKCEVEFLQSTGTQYIDTGVSKGSVSIFRLESIMSFDDISTTNALGCGATLGGGNFGVQSGVNKVFYNLTETDIRTTFSYTSGNKYDFDLNGMGGCFEIKDLSGNTLYRAEETPSMQINDTSLILFGFINKNGSQPKAQTIYKTKIYKNNVLVCDFIPVLDWNDVPCMYDKVRGQLFYNAGTGNFLYGREIHPIEYLGFTGTQYIDTDLYSASDLKVECICSSSTISGFNNALFGGRESNTVKSFTVWKHLVSNSAPRFDFANNQRYATNEQEADVWYKITKDSVDNYVDGVAQASNTDSDFESSTTKLIIGGVRTGTSTFTYSYFQGKIKSAKCWKSGVLKHDFIPSKDENGVGFMFDRITNTIFDNAGTDYFIAGNTLPVKKTQTRFIEDGGL